MKRLFAMLVFLALAVAALSASAESMPGFEFVEPSEDGDDAAAAPSGDAESIQLDINGTRIELGFDHSPTYSSVENGLVHASFYDYGADNTTLYELFITFPATAQSGMVITPDYAALTAAECAVSLIVSNGDDVNYYHAGLIDGVNYPMGSDFSIAFDAVEDSASGRSYDGKLSATLISLDMLSGTVRDAVSFTDAPFRFTMGGDAGSNHYEPVSTPTPPDLRKV